jgi:hypothetical protein
MDVNLSIRELESRITELAGHLNAAQHRWLTLIAEFDRRKGWSDGATYSCAHWLNWKCGIDIGAAREKLRVAHALGRLTKVAAAMERGELSYSKVRAITRVAEEGNEDYFLSIALHGTASHVERLVSSYRRAKEAEELSREAQQQLHRRVQYFFDPDGSMILKARLPAETAALLIRALDLAVEAMPVPDVSAETSQPAGWGAKRADALGILAESFLKHGPQALNGGERHQIVVHVDAETLKDSVAGRCELEDGPAIAAETARRLACDCSAVHILENTNGEPLDIGRKTRSIPPALRRAITARDRGCRFPGCGHKRFVDAHHIHHWARGGETKASNLVTLCRFHHWAVHEGGIRIETLDDGAFRFIRRDGKALDSPRPLHQAAYDWAALAAQNTALGITIDANTAATRWCGERMDYGLGVEVLLAQAAKGAQVTRA